MKAIFFLCVIFVASCAQQSQPVNATVEEFLDGSQISELLVGSCMTGKLADDRPYQRSWKEDKLEEVHTGHNNPLDWHYYHGKWSVSEDGVYTRTIIPWARYYVIGRDGETIIWIEIDENGNRLGNTHYGVIGDECSRL